MSGWLQVACGAVAMFALSCKVSTSYQANLSPMVPPVRAPQAEPARMQSTLVAPPAVSVRPLEADQRKADPEARRLFLTKLGTRERALAPTKSPPRVTAIALENTALGEAAGMTPSTELLSTELKQGERASLPVTIEANECVTFVAQGGLGVVEVDLFLTIGEGDALTIVAEDPTTGPIAVLGGREGCLRMPTHVSANLHLHLRQGAGVVLVRSFKR